MTGGADYLLDDSGADDHRDRLFGKYAGIVVNVDDPDKRGRLKVRVPDLMRSVEESWAMPCIPYAGTKAAFFSVPPVGAGVWVEFEAGDDARPIWSGCYWHESGPPLGPTDSACEPTTHVWRTEFGAVVLDDEAKSVTVTDVECKNMVEIDIEKELVTIKAAKKVVIAVDKLQLVADDASEQAVLGGKLLQFLNDFVQKYSTHTHAETGATTSPPAVPMTPPNQSDLLSTKVKLK
jgi:uncharacterized protein involved in type VI secretion and phage assembly